jgi:hypothetical protein
MRERSMAVHSEAARAHIHRHVSGAFSCCLWREYRVRTTIWLDQKRSPCEGRRVAVVSFDKLGKEDICFGSSLSVTTKQSGAPVGGNATAMPIRVMDGTAEIRKTRRKETRKASSSFITRLAPNARGHRFFLEGRPYGLGLRGGGGAQR